MKTIFILFLLNTLLYSTTKKALVIGNSHYVQGYLANPVNDANLVADSLEKVGFSVDIKNDLKSLYSMKNAINNFAKKLNKDDIAVVYYAGHGVQCKGKNYLIPTEANVIKGAQLPSEALDLDFLIGGLSEIKLAIVMLDACRNNKYPSCSKSQSRGLVQPRISTESGMIVSFATASNMTAEDGDGEHSPYALALSKYMSYSLPIESYFKRVGGEVYKLTGTQRPMLKNSFYGDFYFSKKSEDQIKPVETVSFTKPVEKYSLTINTTPSNANVYIMNISPIYIDGIRLKKGNYTIKVISDGYEKKIFDISLNENMSYDVVLDKKITSHKDIVKIDNLMWQDEPYTTMEKKALRRYSNGINLNKVGNWEYSKKYCKSLSLGGYKNWFVPTIKQLEKLYKNKSKLKNITYSYYWSSSTNFSNGKAFSVSFYSGNTYSYTKTNLYYVLCVRAGQ